MLPHSNLHVLGECGHWLQLEKPSEFDYLVTGFRTSVALAGFGDDHRDTRRPARDPARYCGSWVKRTVLTGGGGDLLAAVRTFPDL
jgi:hypothetical protein